VRTLELLAVGDVSLACRDEQNPFRHVARYLRRGDIVFGNLEGTICDAGLGVEKEITLRVPPLRVGYLRQAGFTVVSAANNHALDFGPSGLREMLAVLRRQDVRFIGVSDHRSDTEGYEIIERDGLKVGFLGFCETPPVGRDDGLFLYPVDGEVVFAQLHRLKPLCDVVVISLHWGIEYAPYPSPRQIDLARDLVAGGASLVLGHHPHIVQGIDELETGLIAYSLGSFQFEPKREEARQSFVLRATLSARGVERYKLIPVRIDEEYRPRLVWGRDRTGVLEVVEQLSLPIREGGITEKWWFEQIAPMYLHGNLRAWKRRIRKYGVRHLAQFLRWLVSRFTIKCYLGLLRTLAGPHE
jgi:hypothetical protein